MKVADSVALVTGANGGLGTAFIAALLERGAERVYAASRRPFAASDDKRVVAVPLDITRLEAVDSAAAQCRDVTLLINNAGANYNAPLIQHRGPEAAREEIEVNYLGTLTMCRAFAPVLRANGGGAIVNIVSILAMVNLPAIGSYAASKAACLSLTQGVRAELAGQGTQVLAVMPGLIDTSMSASRPGTKEMPEEVVSATLDAFEAGQTYVYPGAMAQVVLRALTDDADAIEQRFAMMLPQPAS